MTPQQRRLHRKRRLAHLILGLPGPLARLIAGPPVVRENRVLDRQIQMILKVQERLGVKPLFEIGIARARRQLDAEAQTLAPKAPPLAQVRALEFDGPAGKIRARLYQPHGLVAPAPALVFYHGGGFTVGSLDSHDGPCRDFAARTPCVVISIDYRLAPEHRFPAAVEDAVAAFRAVAAACGELGLDRARLAVGGDSAGANLATETAIHTRGDAVRPCFQLLIYPTTDMTMTFPSIDIFGKGFMLQKAGVEWFRSQYLPPGTDLRDPRASPLYADLAGLPPVLLQTAGFDTLCDEGEAYSRKLREAGVTVEFRRYDGLVHGYLSMSGAVRAARGAVDDMQAALRHAFAG